MQQLSPQLLVALFVRLFAIGLVIYIIRVFSSEIAFFMTAGATDAWWYLPIAGLAILAFMAAFLWKFPEFVARKLLKIEKPLESHQAYSVIDVYSLGFILLGFYLAYWAISDTVYWLAYFRYWNDAYQFAIDPETSVEMKAAVVATIAEIIGAAVLILGNRKIANLIYRIRYGS